MPAPSAASPLFLLAVSAGMYLLAWAVATLYLRLRPGLPARQARRAVFAALTWPIPATLALAAVESVIAPMGMPGMQHHMPLCADIYQSLMGSAGAIPPWLRLAVDGGAWALAAWGLVALVRPLWATLSLEQAIEPYLLPQSAPLERAIRSVGTRIDMAGLAVHECAIPMGGSSLVGLRRVRCVISSELAAVATDDEMEAVVAHEACHWRSGDVGKALAVRALAGLFFYVRPVRLLAGRWRDLAEMACDDAALEATGKPLALASAILRTRGAGSGLGAGVGFASGGDAAARRVERLLDYAEYGSRPTATRGAAAGQWAATVALGAIGLAALLSPDSLCAMHCTLEVAGRFLR